MAKKDTRRGDRHSPGYQAQFKKETYVQFNIRLRKDSGIMDALELVCRKTGMPKSEYVRDAVTEKLISDGYLPEK